MSSCLGRCLDLAVFGRSARINLQEARSLKYEIRRVCLEDPLACTSHRRMIVGVDSRVLVGSVMKGRSSSYKLNGILRSLTSLLVCYRIYLALPWIGTKSNSSDYPSRMVDLPPQPSASPDVVDLVGPVFAREHLVAAPGPCVDTDLKKYESSSSSSCSRVVTDPTISDLVPHANAPTRASSCVDGSLASTAAGHAQDIRPSCRGATVTCPRRFPNLKELRRRVGLCLRDGGQYMQRNFCCPQSERLYHVAPSDAKPGGLEELFAGHAGVARSVGHLSTRTVCAYEPYPDTHDDMGIATEPGAYIRDFDLLLPDVVVDLLSRIYCREITSVHLGPPCVSWSKLYHDLGPGKRSHKS